MVKQQNQQRIKSIYRMLLELANGNLAYRLPVDDRDSQYDEIAKALNDIAIKMQRENYLSPYHSLINIKLTEKNHTTALIQQVQDYILNHLEDPLPSTKQLSAMFGTNEFTLKVHFRNILKTSVYQFYNNERLKKAHFLIQQTTIPLKEIAYMCGFNNYTNFYKAFRKKFAYSPSDLDRRTPD